MTEQCFLLLWKSFSFVFRREKRRTRWLWFASEWKSAWGYVKDQLALCSFSCPLRDNRDRSITAPRDDSRVLQTGDDFLRGKRKEKRRGALVVAFFPFFPQRTARNTFILAGRGNWHSWTGATPNNGRQWSLSASYTAEYTISVSHYEILLSAS